MREDWIKYGELYIDAKFNNHVVCMGCRDVFIDVAVYWEHVEKYHWRNCETSKCHVDFQKAKAGAELLQQNESGKPPIKDIVDLTETDNDDPMENVELEKTNVSIEAEKSVEEFVSESAENLEIDELELQLKRIHGEDHIGTTQELQQELNISEADSRACAHISTPEVLPVEIHSLSSPYTNPEQILTNSKEGNTVIRPISQRSSLDLSIEERITDENSQTTSTCVENWNKNSLYGRVPSYNENNFVFYPQTSSSNKNSPQNLTVSIPLEKVNIPEIVKRLPSGCSYAEYKHRQQLAKVQQQHTESTNVSIDLMDFIEEDGSSKTPSTTTPIASVQQKLLVNPFTMTGSMSRRDSSNVTAEETRIPLDTAPTTVSTMLDQQQVPEDPSAMAISIEPRESSNNTVVEARNSVGAHTTTALQKMNIYSGRHISTATGISPTMLQQNQRNLIASERATAMLQQQEQQTISSSSNSVHLVYSAVNDTNQPPGINVSVMLPQQLQQKTLQQQQQQRNDQQQHLQQYQQQQQYSRNFLPSSCNFHNEHFSSSVLIQEQPQDLRNNFAGFCPFDNGNLYHFPGNPFSPTTSLVPQQIRSSQAISGTSNRRDFNINVAGNRMEQQQQQEQHLFNSLHPRDSTFSNNVNTPEPATSQTLPQQKAIVSSCSPGPSCQRHFTYGVAHSQAIETCFYNSRGIPENTRSIVASTNCPRLQHGATTFHNHQQNGSNQMPPKANESSKTVFCSVCGITLQKRSFRSHKLSQGHRQKNLTQISNREGYVSFHGSYSE